MKKTILLSALAGFILLGNSCRKIEVDGTNISTPPTGGGGTTENTILSGRITADRTLHAAYTYTLRDLVYVTSGATLTIEPGTKIVGEKNSRGALIIARGCKLIANGTVDKPIVFTSDQANPVRGDWAGIVLLGRARTNASFNGTPGLGEAEGGINNGEGLGLYGGTDDNDNSGSLQYVRIEYAGYAFLPDKELNGLSMYAIGKATTMKYIQVSYANDDSFEWFGGTVNMDHLVVYKGLDDEQDSDNGFSGNIQFVICQRDSSVADISGSNGWESDNDANGVAVIIPAGQTAVQPQTKAVWSNVTMVGPRATTANVGNSLFRNGAQIRRNSAISIFNSVMLGWPTGLLIDASTGTPTDVNITGTPSIANQGINLFFQNNIIAGCATPLKYSASTTAPTGWTITDLTNWFNLPANNNSILANSADVKLADAFNATGAPDYTPLAGSPLLSGASFTHAKLAAFTPVAYRGAVGPGDTWWKGWTKF
ncbi:MAG: hypothetical protein D4R55_00775 [Chitinophagaceae bacterium]|nr:MAG: hypothetical protein D4R55_00775 [Chitinophagaceae bacterium]